MRVMRLSEQRKIEKKPLSPGNQDLPEPGEEEVRIKIHLCGVCRTDLHIAEGDIHPPKIPLVPGHQVVGVVDKLGEKTKRNLKIGDRVGVPWLNSTCGDCEFCQGGFENLCSSAKFTGFHLDGGFAEYMVSNSDYVLPIPNSITDEQAAPLLCAGIIGYRSLVRSRIQPGERLGLFGFGASAHIAIQIAHYWRCEVNVFTRSHLHREHATNLGATWVGSAGTTPPKFLNSAIIFAPAGELVPSALEVVSPGGTVAINAIHMSPIPEMDYEKIYGERNLCSVANATYRDGENLLKLAAEIPIISSVELFCLEEANAALAAIKDSRIVGEAVLSIC